MPAHSRFATLEDARQLAELRWLSRGEDERAKEPLAVFERAFEGWLSEALAGGNWRVAVAESPGGGLVGCMYLYLVEKVPTPGEPQRGWGYVTHAYVREGYRAAGIGTSLLASLVDASRAKSLEFLLVWPSREAVTFYERAGFLSPLQERKALPDDEPSFILHLASSGGARHET